MHIQLESSDNHSIQAYSNKEIRIDSKDYSESIIINKKEIITNINIKGLADIDTKLINRIRDLSPDVVIIGHCERSQLPPLDIVTDLAKDRIGMECMSMGAACRTFNVLLSEQREAVGLFILKEK